jgi:hypothetical protein
VTYVISLLWVAASTLGTIIGVVSTLASDAAIAVTLPVRPFFPDVNEGVEITDGPSAEIVGGGFESANVMLTGLDMTARLWIAGGHFSQGLTNVLVGIAVATLCTRVMNRDPFREAMTRAVQMAAASIVLGGIIWQICFAIGDNLAATQALTVTGWTYTDGDVPADGSLDIGWPTPSGAAFIDFWPIWVGLALFVLAAAFQYGEKLQNDNERLQDDTKGLV